MEGRLARDRLFTTLVLAGTLHGLIILGVSFTAPESKGDGAQGMEILLVSDELPEARSNDSAAYLSQRTQTGSGNSKERLPAEMPSEAQPVAASEESRPAENPGEQLLTTSAAGPTRIRVAPLPDPATTRVAQQVPQQAEPQLAGDGNLRLRGEARDELYVTADTRASRLAPYLDSWRRRVERIGTLNYPTVAQRRGLSGNPVIEVALQRDGKLQSARIQHSSGNAEIDAAALAILRLASPFDAFPPELAREYRTLRFAYEWRFEGAGGFHGTVISP